MPIIRVDYEIAPADTVELPAVNTVSPAESEVPAAKPMDLAGASTNAPTPQLTPNANETPEDASQQEEADEVDAGMDAPPAGDGPQEQPTAGPPAAIPSSPPPQEDQNENAAGPAWSGGGGDFTNRLDAARGRLNNQTQGADELLEQAVTMLEALASHPAMADYAALKQRLDNVEQLLNSSANVS